MGAAQYDVTHTVLYATHAATDRLFIPQNGPLVSSKSTGDSDNRDENMAEQLAFCKNLSPKGEPRKSSDKETDAWPETALISGPTEAAKDGVIELSCAAYSPDDIASYKWTVAGSSGTPVFGDDDASTTSVTFDGTASIEYTFTCTVTNKKSTPSTFTDTHKVTTGA